MIPEQALALATQGVGAQISNLVEAITDAASAVRDTIREE